MLDLATEKGVLEFCEAQRREMEAVFGDLGRFEMNGYSFGAYILATHEVQPPERVELGARPEAPRKLADVVAGWKTGDPLPRTRADLCKLPEWIRAVLPVEDHTAFFGSVVRVLSEKSRAIGTVVMGEMWMAQPAHVPGETAEQARSKLPRSLADYDGREEGLFLRLEHKVTGPRMWTKKIVRNPDGLAADWVLNDYKNAEGRLVNLVP
jgi:hypothetical protein